MREGLAHVPALDAADWHSGLRARASRRSSFGSFPARRTSGAPCAMPDEGVASARRPDALPKLQRGARALVRDVHLAEIVPYGSPLAAAKAAFRRDGRRDVGPCVAGGRRPDIALIGQIDGAHSDCGRCSGGRGFVGPPFYGEHRSSRHRRSWPSSSRWVRGRGALGDGDLFSHRVAEELSGCARSVRFRSQARRWER